MSYPFYKILHILGALLLFMSLGGAAMHALNGGTKDTNPKRGFVAATHGLSLVILLVAGFGAAGKAGMFANGFPAWLVAKVIIWLFFGGIIAVIYRKPEAAAPLWVALPVLGGVAAWLAVAKPF